MIKNLFKLRLYALLCLFLVTLIDKTYAQRIGHSSQPWKMIITEHFEIFYSAQHQDLGLYYSQITEQSYKEITTVFTEKPVEKIVVILNDSTDISNGFTTLIPYPYIMIYPVQVGPYETLSESGEWAKELFIHELTHVFQLYPARGFYSWLKPVFGTIIAPNMLMPLWWKEGMAVEIETRFSHQGRLRSNYQDASIRALVLDDKLFKYSISEINEVLPSWPYGNRPYLFGSILMQQIDQRKTDSTNTNNNINSVVVDQSERLPYFIEQPMKDLFGHGYESHYFQTLNDYHTQADTQIQTIKKTNTTDETFRIIDDQVISSRSPRFNKTDHTLGMIVSEKNGKKLALYRLNDDQKWIKLKLKHIPKDNILSFEFHPSKPIVVFSKVDNYSSQEIFADLYLYNYETDQTLRLTSAQRARQPKWNFDGSAICFISTFDGKTQIKDLKLNEQNFNFNIKKHNLVGKMLFETGLSQRIHELFPLSSHEILLNIVNEVGVRQQIVLNTDNLKTTNFSQLKPQAEGFKQQQSFLYYSSTANGVSNIYKFDLTNNQNTALTNMIIGTLDFDINDESGFATILTGQGPQVFSFKTQEYKKLPEIKNTFRNAYNDQNLATATEIQTETQDAVSAKYLYPHYFIPFVSTSTNDQSLYLQLMTSGQDPLLIHQYNLSIDYDSYIKKAGYSVNYINSYYETSLAAQSYRKFRSFGLDTKALEKNETALALVPDTFEVSSNLQFMIGLLDQSTDDGYRPTHHIGGFTQILYKDVSKTIFNIYPTKGGSILIRYENNHAQDRSAPDILKDFEQITGSLQYYFSAWLPEDHSLSFKVDFLHTFQNVSSRFGTSNAVSSMMTDSGLPEFIFRGYSLGQFYGSRLATYNQEYRFPIKTLNRGNGTDPYFIKKLNGAIVVDGLTVKGSAFDKNQFIASEDMQRIYWSYGAEARLETTIGYLLPVNFILGFYVPTAPKFSDSAQTALSLQIGGFNR